MHITLEADYAVRIVVFLAKQNKRTDANKIAENTGVTLRFTLKILRNLVAKEITKSFKGTQGGYELNKSVEEITLKEILEAVEGEYAFSRCLAAGNCCSRPDSHDCKVQAIYSDISKKVQEMLEEVTVADLID